MKFEHTNVWGFSHAMRGMRNPKNSWNKNDTIAYNVNDDSIPSEWYDLGVPVDEHCSEFVSIGENDMKLAQTLIRAGSEHRKFLRQIFVSVDITAPLYWWKEFDTYKVGTVANSTSTMHKLTAEPITIDCFEIDDYKPELIFESGIDDSGDTPWEYDVDVDCVIGSYEDNYFRNQTFISFLESLRKKYIETIDKRYWKELVRWLPLSWLQKRTVTMNYENILCIVHQRKNHKLNEWSGIDIVTNPNFIAWARSLPYANELLFGGISNEEKSE